MKHTKIASIICTAAVLLSASGCRSTETVRDNTAAPQSLPAVETTGATNIPDSTTDPVVNDTTENAASATSAAIAPQQSAGTEVVDSETYDVYTTGTAIEVTSAAHDQDIVTEIIDGQSYAVMTTASTTTARISTDITTSSRIDTVQSFETTAAPEPDFKGIRLEVVSGADRITTAVDHISLKMSYVGGETGQFFMTGEKYYLEKYDNGKWRRLEYAGERIWYDLAYEVSEYSSPTFGIALDDNSYTEPVNAGKYRIVKNVVSVSGASEDLYAEFEIEDDDSEPVYELVEENGSITLRIVEIQPEGFLRSRFRGSITLNVIRLFIRISASETI